MKSGMSFLCAWLLGAIAGACSLAITLHYGLISPPLGQRVQEIAFPQLQLFMMAPASDDYAVVQLNGGIATITFSALPQIGSPYFRSGAEL